MANGDNLVLGQDNDATSATRVTFFPAPNTPPEWGYVLMGDPQFNFTLLSRCHLDYSVGLWGSANGVRSAVGVLGSGQYGVIGYVADETSPVERAGVYGIGIRDVDTGVWGRNLDGGIAVRGESIDGSGVVGTSTTGFGVSGFSDRSVGVWGVTGNVRGSYAGGFWGGVFVAGDLFVAGAKSAVVRHPDGSHRRLYSVESPESWFEDFGHAALVRGRARVRLDRDFARLVRARRYHVFVTPLGDSNGLYVSRVNATGFEVREQRDGKSNIRFSYRVVAKRRDVPAPRLAKVTPPKPPHVPKRPARPPLRLPRLPDRSSSVARPRTRTAK